MTTAERDARIRAIEIACHEARGKFDADAAFMVGVALADTEVPWLIAELRAALSREEALDDALDYERRKDRSEAIKDAGRMDYLEAHLERLTVTRFAEPVGGRSVVVGLSHAPSPNILAGAGGDSIREAADRAMSFSARSVSLSENG